MGTDKCDAHPLAAAALLDVTSFLAKSESSLAGPSLTAVQALLQALEDGLNDHLPAEYFLSSIDPGIGKTLSVSKFLKVWKDASFSPGNGVIVAVSRLEEINTYIGQAILTPPDFAVLTSDKDLNALGTDAHGLAPIMFTTQQMIMSRCRSATPFDALSEFHYRGKSRSLKIWDESIVPEETVALRVDDLGLVAPSLRRSDPAFVDAVTRLQQQLWHLKPGDEITIPADVASAAPNRPAGQVAGVVQALKLLAGQTLQVSNVGNDGLSIIGSGVALPEDFPPAVILDASGRVRPTYRLWENHRGNLKRLPSAMNDYRQLEIHLWQRGSGKVTMSKQGEPQEIAGVLLALIEANEADEDWLIIHYKDTSTIPAILRDRLGAKAEHIKSLTWGRHHGTNEFASVKNVIIIGQLTYSETGYRALASAASGLPPRQLEDNIDLQDFRWGEFQHHLLQALCRASVRTSRDGVAGACRAFVISTPSRQTKERVEATFPGCQLVDWNPIPKEESEYVTRAIVFLKEQAEAGTFGVSKEAVREHAGIGRQNFKRDITDTRGFQAYLKDSDWRVEKAFFTRSAFEPYVEEKDL